MSIVVFLEASRLEGALHGASPGLDQVHQRQARDCHMAGNWIQPRALGRVGGPVSTTDILHPSSMSRAQRECRLRQCRKQAGAIYSIIPRF